MRKILIVLSILSLSMAGTVYLAYDFEETENIAIGYNHIVKQTENFPSSVSFGNMYILFDIFFPDEIDIKKSLVESAKDGVPTTKLEQAQHNTEENATIKSYQFEDLEDDKPSNIYSKFLIKKNNNECVIM